MSRITVLFVFSALLSACRDSGAGSFVASVRDSAGIQVVETAGDLWGAPVRWSTSAEPVVRIGTVEGDKAYLFDGIRGIVVLSDGRVVVANMGDNTIRWYSPDGRFLFQRGGPGEGPGEFSRLGQVTVLEGDTVVAVDWADHRFTLFGPDGELGPITRINGLIAPPGRIYRTAEGEWILGTGGFSSSQLGGRPNPGVHRFDSPVLRISRDGARTDTLGHFPSSEVEVKVNGTRTSFSAAPFGRSLTYALLNDEVVIATGDRLQFDFYSPSGEHLRSVRALDVDLRLTSEIAAAYQNHLRERAEDAPEDQQAEVERTIAEMTLPETMPALSSVIVADNGHMWVGKYRYDRSPAEQYLVFDSEGRFLGRASVPPRVGVVAIRDGQVWGRTTDEFGVEYVVSYALHEQ